MNTLSEKLKPHSGRLISIDLLRGWVMVIMALDHVRDHFTNAHFDPTDLSQTNAALFFTRWITHFCAPVFFFLAGVSAFLSTTRGRTRTELAFYLFTRGLWLMLLEITLVGFAWTFNFSHGEIGLAVIWALGGAMVVLAGLVYLPRWAIAAFGLVLVAGHNLFDGLEAEGIWKGIWAILHSREAIPITANLSLDPFYPLIPWIGVMAVGYAFGPLLLQERPQRQRQMLVLGALLTGLFIVLRAVNGYGDSHPWSIQQSRLFTLLSFLDTTKYPPSLLYLLMTLGPAIAALALLEKVSGAWTRFFIVFGQVPLFFYLLHLYLIHLLALGVGYLSGYNIQAFLTPFWLFPKDYGFGLPLIYLLWIGLIFALYPVCIGYRQLKINRRHWLLSYL
ncbi:conserved hypothetical protein [Nitrosococcus halophilus Nc 4]|uniref:Heparan-alpha-glucosaminide N-acetyltransferase catalytic domain-containing protein n=1 Tax=Nitrosococcus halophilus (strain Nc4) TaxID=472759 RepID=D5BYJ4_NITHN|nr:heparan-alpha-glucosaminide N-acetyltransferase domain-containing protein [Nitrosococcus halophilus]ADE15982.1 conserved hypothetical protein [Nitrosococcus halophilus Nc 4]